MENISLIRNKAGVWGVNVMGNDYVDDLRFFSQYLLSWIID